MLSPKKQKALVSSVLILLILSGYIPYYQNNKASAASYYWTQQSWQSASPDSANHTDNRSNWTKFESKDDQVNLASGGEELTVTPSSGTASQTSETDFSQGDFVQTQQNGSSGDQASLNLGVLGSNVSVSAGIYDTCIVGSSGKVYCWGRENGGNLGIAAGVGRYVPQPVVKGAAKAEDTDGTYLTNIRQIALGDSHTCAVSNSGNAYCWGSSGSYGALGNGLTSVISTSPARILKGAAAAEDTDGMYLTNIKHVTAGNYHTCAVSNSGNVYCWGNNNYGQLGNNSTTNMPTPVRVLKGEAVSEDANDTDLTNAGQIFAGSDSYYTCLRSNSGNAYCWGRNNYGQLGDGTTTDRSVPVRVLKGAAAEDADGMNLADVKQLAVGSYHVCAISGSSSVYCWGRNNYGQLGDGTTTDRSVPVRVLKGAAAVEDTDSTYLMNAMRISAGSNSVCAVSNKSNAYCWGYNSDGKLGDGTATHKYTPIRVAKGAAAAEDTDGTYLVNVKQISTGYSHSCALSGSSSVYCWGSNSVSGALGISDSIMDHSLTPIKPLRGGTLEAANNIVTKEFDADSFAQISTGNFFSCGLTILGEVYCWGAGQQGNNFATLDKKVLKGAAIAGDSNGAYLANIRQLSVGNEHVCAVSNSDNIYCWGSGVNGGLGSGYSNDSLTPNRVSKGAAAALDTDGTYLGNIRQVSAGYWSSCAVSNSGNAYCWGYNSDGKLGDGTANQKYTPIRVAKGAAAAEDTDGTYLVNVKQISTGYVHSCALSNSGNAYCWGSNVYGQLGDNTTVSSYVPIHVVKGAAAVEDTDGTYFKNIKEIFASNYYSTCALSDSGNAYCWGFNMYGRLGDGTTTHRSAPVRVLKGTAIAEDANDIYLANIKQISVGYYHSCTLSNSGNVYCWGGGFGGRTGDGSSSSSNRLTPVRVVKGGAVPEDIDGEYLANIKSVFGNSSHGCAISNSGNTYCWGNNTYGQLGDGTTIDRFAPVTLQTYVSGEKYFTLPFIYVTSGSYTSSVVAASADGTTWQSLSVQGDIPDGVEIEVRVKSSTTDTVEDVESCEAVATFSSSNQDDPVDISSSECVTPGHKYLRYQFSISSSNQNVTPSIDQVDLRYFTSIYSLTSSPYDTSDEANVVAGIKWTEETPDNTDVRFQVRTSPDNISWTDWMGPGGSGDYFTNHEGQAMNDLLADGSNDRFVQYKAQFVSEDGISSPTLSDVSLSYVVNAPPEVQNVIAKQKADGSVSVSYQVRDVDTALGSVTPGYITPSFQYWDGNSWQDCQALSETDTQNKQVESEDYETYVATWRAKEDYPEIFTDSAKIRVVADDNEAANDIASAQSTGFTLDTKNPSLGEVPISFDGPDHSAHLAASDDSSLSMRLAVADNEVSCQEALSVKEYEAYASTNEFQEEGYFGTACVQFRDNRDNSSSVRFTTLPDKIEKVFVQDTSSIDQGRYRLYVSWSPTTMDEKDFDSYRIYRSETEGGVYQYLTSTKVGEIDVDSFSDSVDKDDEYFYEVAVKDKHGNISYLSDPLHGVANATQDAGEGGGGVSGDVAAPAITEEPEVEVSDKNEVVVSWKTDEESDSYVEYGETDAYGSDYGSGSLTTNHEVTLPKDLESDVLYHLRVRSQDASGNKVVSEDYTFRTRKLEEGTGSGDDDSGDDAFSLSGVKASNATASAVEIEWETGTETNGSVVYGLTKEYNLGATETLTYKKEDYSKGHKVTLSSLLSNATYHYAVISIDKDGNAVSSSDKTFTTSELSSITDVKATNITISSAVITWETGSPSRAELEYGPTSRYGKTESDNNLSNSHKIELDDLQPDQTYHFRIKNTGKNDSISASDDYTFATYAQPKLERYSIEEVRDTEAVIKWKTNIPMQSFVEYANAEDNEDKGIQGSGQETDDHRVNLKGLRQGSKYVFRIKGEDANKNSFESDNLSLETQADKVAPKISQVTIQSSFIGGSGDKIQTIVSWRTDEPATTKVLYGLGKDKEQQVKEDENLTTTHVIVLTNLKPGLIYHFQVASKDKNGNATNSQDYISLAPNKQLSVVQMMVMNFEQNFGWLKGLKW